MIKFIVSLLTEYGFLGKLSVFLTTSLILVAGVVAFIKPSLVIKTFKLIWELLKRMKSPKGIISIITVWLIISGAGLMAIGLIFQIQKLFIIGSMIYGVWLMPATPLMLITLLLGLVFQRVVLRDKTVSWDEIKGLYKEIFRREKGESYERENEQDKQRID